jgi:Fe-S-cluster containining protein
MPPEGFVCKQCGHCCLHLGAYQTCATEEDIASWEEHGRDDLLDWVIQIAPGVYDIWMNPETGDYVNRCPWLDRKPGQGKYICRIQALKPEICRDYPVSKEHAEETGCPGFVATD